MTEPANPLVLDAGVSHAKRLAGALVSMLAGGQNSRFAKAARFAQQNPLRPTDATPAPVPRPGRDPHQSRSKYVPGGGKR